MANSLDNLAANITEVFRITSSNSQALLGYGGADIAHPIPMLAGGDLLLVIKEENGDFTREDFANATMSIYYSESNSNNVAGLTPDVVVKGNGVPLKSSGDVMGIALVKSNGASWAKVRIDIPNNTLANGGDELFAIRAWSKENNPVLGGTL